MNSRARVWVMLQVGRLRKCESEDWDEESMGSLRVHEERSMGEASSLVLEDRALLDVTTTKKKAEATEPLLASLLTLRSIPVSGFVKAKRPWPIVITSIGEDHLLEKMGLSKARHMPPRPIVTCHHALLPRWYVFIASAHASTARTACGWCCRRFELLATGYWLLAIAAGY